MVEVPVCVDQVGDRIGAEVCQGLHQLRARDSNAGINQHLAVRARQHGNRAARSFQHADIVAELVRDDRRYGCAVLDQADDAARLRKHVAWREPSSRSRASRAANAAEAEAASGQQSSARDFHGTIAPA